MAQGPAVLMNILGSSNVDSPRAPSWEFGPKVKPKFLAWRTKYMTIRCQPALLSSLPVMIPLQILCSSIWGSHHVKFSLFMYVYIYILYLCYIYIHFRQSEGLQLELCVVYMGYVYLTSLLKGIRICCPQSATLAQRLP